MIFCTGLFFTVGLYIIRTFYANGRNGEPEFIADGQRRLHHILEVLAEDLDTHKADLMVFNNSDHNVAGFLIAFCKQIIRRSVLIHRH